MCLRRPQHIRSLLAVAILQMPRRTLSLLESPCYHRYDQAATYAEVDRAGYQDLEMAQQALNPSRPNTLTSPVKPRGPCGRDSFRSIDYRSSQCTYSWPLHAQSNSERNSMPPTASSAPPAWSLLVSLDGGKVRQEHAGQWRMNAEARSGRPQVPERTNPGYHI